MTRRVWVEGLSLVALSLVSLVDSLRLIFYTDPTILYDPLGPGYYLLFVSIGLSATGVIYIYHHLRKGQSISKKETSKEMRIRLIASFVVCAIYLVLVDVIGYAIATFIFLMLMFRIVGIRSWPYNVALSAFLSAALYFVFVKYCDVVFPQGILF